MRPESSGPRTGDRIALEPTQTLPLPSASSLAQGTAPDRKQAGLETQASLRQLWDTGLSEATPLVF